MKTVSDIQIPFDDKGNQMWLKEHGTHMKDNYVFKDSLKYRGYRTGRSSVNIYLEDSKGNTYITTLNEFDKMLTLTGGILPIKGEFSFKKRGRHHHIYLLTLSK